MLLPVSLNTPTHEGPHLTPPCVCILYLGRGAFIPCDIAPFRGTRYYTPLEPPRVHRALPNKRAPSNGRNDAADNPQGEGGIRNDPGVVSLLIGHPARSQREREREREREGSNNGDSSRFQLLNEMSMAGGEAKKEETIRSIETTSRCRAWKVVVVFEFH